LCQSSKRRQAFAEVSYTCLVSLCVVCITPPFLPFDRRAASAVWFSKHHPQGRLQETLGRKQRWEASHPFALLYCVPPTTRPGTLTTPPAMLISPARRPCTLLTSASPQAFFHSFASGGGFQRVFPRLKAGANSQHALLERGGSSHDQALVRRPHCLPGCGPVVRFLTHPSSILSTHIHSQGVATMASF
jgi:hypothetical protein